MEFTFTDDFDAQLAETGPPGLFTMNHDGELQFDLFRTRDWRRRFWSEEDKGSNTLEFCHCVCIDATTQWPMYVLITSAQLVQSDERTTTERLKDYASAQRRLSELKALRFT